jgi:hypothetical protein
MVNPDHTPQAIAFVPLEPALDRIGFAWLHETMAGNGVRGLPVGNVQQGGAAFTDRGPPSMTAMVVEVLALGVGHCYGPAAWHQTSCHYAPNSLPLYYPF